MEMHLSLDEIESVYCRRGADFFRLALARTGDAEAAREAVQEGFASAIRGRHTYRGEGSVESWIARCVINAAQDAAGASRFTADAEDVTAVDEQERAAGSPGAVEAEIVREAIRRLPKRQRDALFLRFYLGFDYAAIAETLGIAMGTVSATLHAARAAVADRLKEQEVAR
jgi:RNA polymerase sigma-70 factor, ECF subfamily